MRRSLDIAKGAVASAAVALLVVGLPALLVTSVGWPLPKQLPQLGDLADTIAGHQPLETTTVWKILAVIVWLAWLQVVAAVVVESVSVARGSVPPSLHGINLAQGLVAPLVAAIVLAWPAGAASRASAAPGPAIERRDPPPATIVDAPPPPTLPSLAASPAPSATVEHVVERRDTLWDLAERYLGDGYRAPEIFEINRGRPQPDGRALTDPGLLRPGWVLHIPQSAPPTPVGSVDSVTVEDGDTLWDIAAHELHDGHRFVEIVDLNRGRPQPDGTLLTDPDLIEPGWVLKLPGDATVPRGPAPAATSAPLPPPTPVIAATASAPILDPATTRALPSAPRSEARPADGLHAIADDDTEHPKPLAPLGLVGGGIATAGILAVLDRRRRAQLRRRRRGQVPPPLTPAQRGTEAELRAGADVAGAASVDGVTRAAAAASGAAGLPTIERVEAAEDRVALVLASPAPAPPGFVATAAAQWQPSEPLGTSDPIGGSPAPALVAVGTGPDGTEVLLDLEHPAITTITGDDQAAHRFANALALAVATSPWSDHANLLAVGIQPLPLDDVKHIESLDAALDALDSRVELIAKALDAARCPTPAQARAVGDTPDMWTPIVLISMIEPTEPQLARMRALAARDPHGVALVIRGNADASIGRVIDIHNEGTATIEGDLVIHPHLIDDEQLSGIGDLLDHANQVCITNDHVRQVARRRQPDAAGGAGILETLLADVDVLVRVLGDVEVVRADQPDTRLTVPKQKSLEAVTYLGLREGRVDREDLQAALWPAGANSAKTFHNTIWAARKMLAQDRDGVELLPEPLEGHYHLSDRVGTDYGMFHELAARADEVDDPAAASDLLAAALSLVRGEPFMGVGRGYAWAAPHAGLIVAQVVDAAEELAEVRLAAGDWRAAEWAARQGLRVFPCEERLYRLLMRAAHAAGSVPGVHRAFQELAATVADPDDGVEPDDTLHPETIALLDELTGQGPRLNRASA